MSGFDVRQFVLPGLFAVVFCLASTHEVKAQPPSNGNLPLEDSSQAWEPTNPAALRSYRAALQQLALGDRERAIAGLREAARQDGHCVDCLRQAYSLASRIARFDLAEAVAHDWLLMADSDVNRAAAHYRIGVALQQQGIQRGKRKLISQSCQEFQTALNLVPGGLTAAHYDLGISLAHLHQDGAARAEFSTFLARDTSASNEHERAQRFLKRIELARAHMAPPFSITTIDGRRISLDSLAGKVVLIDFWAMWCAPCVEALPQLRELVHQLKGEPFVVISISLDADEARWRDFIAKNQMTWPQYRDGSVNGPIATAFRITAVPATFTIDADGVLKIQHIKENGFVESELKRLIEGGKAQHVSASDTSK